MQVISAKPYSSDLGSRDNTRYMYLRQFRFPDAFDDRDKIASGDSDRMDFEHVWRCFGEHARIFSNIEEWKLEGWILGVSDEEIMAFLKDIMKEESTDVLWTGYRIMASIANNGHFIWHFQLFAKDANSDTVVYSCPNAPNVRN